MSQRLNLMELEKCPVVIETPVAWGEMDAFAHVNNIVYFRYFESARIVYFEKIGANQSMREHKIGPILASAQCRFKAPLTYPDNLSIGTLVSDIGDDRFTMKYYVASHSLGRIAAEGEGLVVFYDYANNEKTHIPAHIRVAMDKLIWH